MGWNISGLSAITRVNKNIYFDDTKSGINISIKDAFMLDGIRLLEKNNNSPIKEYIPEEGNFKIYANRTSTTINYFDVEYPNGVKGRFYPKLNGLVYPISELEDAFGNKIEYKYLEDNNVCYIVQKYRIKK